MLGLESEPLVIQPTLTAPEMIWLLEKALSTRTSFTRKYFKKVRREAAGIPPSSFSTAVKYAGRAAFYMRISISSKINSRINNKIINGL